MKLLPVFVLLGGIALVAGRAQSDSEAPVLDLKSESRLASWGPYRSKGLARPELSSIEVLKAVSRVPRHEFVEQPYTLEAYQDHPLPIGEGQTISQPFIVAYMTQEARVHAGSKVLEIGTGSGYQAAVLAEMGTRVFTLEIIPELARKASKKLKALGYTEITVITADGALGHEREAPYQAIIVTAAAPRVPPKLLEQLADNGRLLIPIVQGHDKGESLMVFQRQGNKITSSHLLPVAFVPLTGIDGQSLHK